MKSVVLAFTVVLVGCTHNYAARYVEAIAPGADILASSGQTVLLVQGSQMVICKANDQHVTICGLVADWTPRTTAAPPVRTTDPTSPAHASTPAPAPTPAESSLRRRLDAEAAAARSAESGRDVDPNATTTLPPGGVPPK